MGHLSRLAKPHLSFEPKFGILRSRNEGRGEENGSDMCNDDEEKDDGQWTEPDSDVRQH